MRVIEVSYTVPVSRAVTTNATSTHQVTDQVTVTVAVEPREEVEAAHAHARETALALAAGGVVSTKAQPKQLLEESKVPGGGATAAPTVSLPPGNLG